MRYLLLIIAGISLMAEEGLQGVLDEHYKHFLEDSSAKAVQAVKDDLKERRALKMKKDIPKAGDKAIDFTLKTIEGKTFQLYKALKTSPVVLFWYRGGWCPYCNTQLSYYQKYMKEISSLGVQVVGVSPENPRMGKETKEDNALEFELLSDVNHTVAREYNIVYTVKPNLYRMMDQALDLYDYYDKENTELPLTVLYVIDQSGTIRYAFIDEDFTKRADPAEFISVIRSL